MIKTTKKNKMKYYLFTTYFKSKSPEREAEYDYCVRKNMFAELDGIYLLVENEEDRKEATKKFCSSNCYVICMYPSKRPTFKDFFDFINTTHGENIWNYNFEDSINIIANTDIFFLNMQQIEANLHRLRRGRTCFALTRYDYHLNRGSNLHDVPDSQDTWIFNGKELLGNINADFSMGVRGCDNRLAHELMQAGFEVLNPSKSICTFHLHDVPIRTYLDNNEPAVPPPYLLLPTHE